MQTQNIEPALPIRDSPMKKETVRTIFHGKKFNIATIISGTSNQLIQALQTLLVRILLAITIHVF
jgi:hypothetical protein